MTVDAPPRASQFLSDFPASVWAATALVLGVAVGELLPTAAGIYLSILTIWLVVAFHIRRRGSVRLTSTVVIACFSIAGVCRWQLAKMGGQSEVLTDLAKSGNQTVQVDATIGSVPVVRVRPASKVSPRLYGSPEQTQFLVDVQKIRTDEGDKAIRGSCQVYVDGNASTILSAGDSVVLTGNLDWPGPPANPGEFDFQKYLSRRRVSALMYVNHIQAIRVTQPAGRHSVGRVISGLRSSARQVLVDNIDPDVLGVALALLMGNRHQLPSETEEAFIASGTMHLLAISGLHVGILCLFLLRILNLLIVRRGTALFSTAAICLVYAMVTDLRPSVVRATVFFLVFAIGQGIGRNLRISSLISITVLVMILWSPELVFNTGAWLSFLSVVALGWVSLSRERQSREDTEAPADALTLRDQFRESISAVGQWLGLRYRQMLYILAFTSPLIASTFHVVSPVGLIINVVLILFTAVTLCCGFATLFLGLLLPVLANGPGYVFSLMLNILVGIVEATASVNAGHLYVPDFPAWFVPCYYILLISALVIRQPWMKNFLVAGLFCCVMAAFNFSKPESTHEYRCTALSVGHGSATLIESPDGRVFVVDAGAMNRGSRAADILCRYLWARGHRRIDGLLISHADMDHYNAVPEIMARFPVAALLTSVEVARSKSGSVQAVLDFARDTDVPVTLLHHGDAAKFGEASITILQANPTSWTEEFEDNETSLVVMLEYENRRVLMPGDLEGKATEEILPFLSDIDILFSPHHGSIAANSESLAAATNPEYVIVSARDADSRTVLEQIYAQSRRVFFTSDSGTVTATIGRNQPVRMTTHLAM